MQFRSSQKLALLKKSLVYQLASKSSRNTPSVLNFVGAMIILGIVLFWFRWARSPVILSSFTSFVFVPSLLPIVRLYIIKGGRLRLILFLLWLLLVSSINVAWLVISLIPSLKWSRNEWISINAFTWQLTWSSSALGKRIPDLILLVDKT